MKRLMLLLAAVGAAGAVGLICFPHVLAAPGQDAPAKSQVESADQEGAVEEAADSNSDVEEATSAPLEELAWLVGEWIDQGPDATNVSAVKWTRNQAFLTRTFQVIVEGEVTLEGTQVIGWDAAQQRIRSWVFDSSGGFGEGIWMRDGDQWLIKKTFVLPTGERASALNVITYVDENTFKYKSINREIGGQLQPNVPDITVSRKRQAGDEQADREPESNEQQEQAGKETAK